MTFILLLIPISLLGATLPEIEVLALDGTKQSGTLDEVNEQEVTIRDANAFHTLAIKDVQAIKFSGAGAEPAALPAVWITLVDGTVLQAQSYRVADGSSEVVLLEGTQISIPTNRLRHVRFKQQNPDQAEQWQRAMNVNAAGDLLVIRKGEAIDYLEGLLRNVSAESVEFQLDADWIPVGRKKVEGLVYSQAEAVEQSPGRGQLFDRTGSRIVVSQLRLDPQVLHVTTPAGIEIARPLELVDRLEFVDENVVYLSDLEPTDVQWSPLFETPSAATISEKLRAAQLAPRRDRALGATSEEDAALRLRYHHERGPDEIQEYDRGLAISSRTTMTFELPADALRFKAIAGIDEREAARGDVQLVIRGDDQVLFDATISGSQSPQSLDLDIEKVEQLTILVDYGENGDTGDHLNLCEARIVK